MEGEGGTAVLAASDEVWSIRVGQLARNALWSYGRTLDHSVMRAPGANNA